MNKGIVFVWVGDAKFTESEITCFKSWKKHCPSSQIIRLGNDYYEELLQKGEIPIAIKKAFENKRYAFVSDYLRVYYLYENGGLYMDTDYELAKNPWDNLPDFGDNDEICYMGMETFRTPGTCFIYCPNPGNPWMKAYIDHYKSLKSVSMANTLILTKYLFPQFGMDNKEELYFNRLNNYEYLNFKYYKLRLYNRKYLCPVSWTGSLQKDLSKVVGFHYFNGSWTKPNMYIKDVRDKIKFLKEQIGDKND